jgi:hypothetical protein
VILAVCKDKRGGVTTAATALSVVCPGDRVLLEADPSGGDLALRLRNPHGGNLSTERSVTSLAADAREGVPAGALARYAQPTSLGFPVLIAPPSAEGFDPMARLWPQVAVAARAWHGTVVADLGRLQLRHPSSPLAAAASVVLLLTRADTSEDLFHVRQRAHELAARLGQGQHGRSPLAVAVEAPPRSARTAVQQVQQTLTSQASTSTIPVVGCLAEDPRGVQELRAGELNKRLLSTDLIKSARGLVQTLMGWFPAAAATQSPVAPAQAAPQPASADPYPGHWGTSTGRVLPGGETA